MFLFRKYQSKNQKSPDCITLTLFAWLDLFFLAQMLCTLCHFLSSIHFLFLVCWIVCLHPHLSELHQGSLASGMEYTLLHRPVFPCLDHSSSDELPHFPKWSRLSKESNFKVNHKALVWKRPDALIDNIHAKKAKIKHWTSAKVHWWDDNKAEGEQAVNAVGAPFQVMSRSFCCHYTASAFRERRGKSNAPHHSTPLHSCHCLTHACLLLQQGDCIIQVCKTGFLRHCKDLRVE